MSYLVIVDIETSGLDETKHMIFEVGISIRRLDLTTVAEANGIIVDDNSIAHLDALAHAAELELQPEYRGRDPWKGDRIVHEMHQKSGLAEQIRSLYASGYRHDRGQLEQELCDWLESYNINWKGGQKGLPMVGSSVGFDRKFIARQMPKLNDHFHYRNIDISSLKGIAELYRQDVVDARQQELDPASLHRSLPDCEDSTSELRFYLERMIAKGA